MHRQCMKQQTYHELDEVLERCIQNLGIVYDARFHALRVTYKHIERVRCIRNLLVISIIFIMAVARIMYTRFLSSCCVAFNTVLYAESLKHG
jgi:hypothetical protein